jgi:hypothetical protein
MALLPSSALHFKRSFRLDTAHQHLDPGWINVRYLVERQIEAANESKSAGRIKHTVQRCGANIVFQALKTTPTMGIVKAHVQCRGCVQ